MNVSSVSLIRAAEPHATAIQDSAKIKTDVAAQNSNQEKSKPKVHEFPDTKGSERELPDKTHVHFIRYPKINDYYIQVLDDRTNKVVREIPPKQILDLYVSMMERFGLVSGKKGKVDHS